MARPGMKRRGPRKSPASTPALIPPSAPPPGGVAAAGPRLFSPPPGGPREPLARGQLVLVGPEGHRVVAAVSRRLQPVEQRLEIDGALTGVEVDLVLARVVGQAHLADAAD